jgi:hypothetical protein
MDWRQVSRGSTDHHGHLMFRARLGFGMGRTSRFESLLWLGNVEIGGSRCARGMPDHGHG